MSQVSQGSQANGFAAGKGFGRQDAGHDTPVSITIKHAVDHTWMTGGLIGYKLTLIGFEHFAFKVGESGNVKEDAGSFDDSQMHAEIVEDTCRVKRLAGHV